MTARAGRDAARPLEAVGIGEDEEQAYRALLARPMATLDELARALAQPARRVLQLLDALERHGLATHSPQRPRRYVPAAPDFALEALIRERQQHLERVRLAIAELKEHAANAHAGDEREQHVELITEIAAARQLLRHLQSATHEDVVCLQRTPTVLTGLAPPDGAPPRRLPRGSRSRSIADQAFLALPGAVERIRYDMQGGEEVRAYPVLPFKLLVVDRRIGFLPLNLRKPDGPWLLVRSSALLDALYELFEVLWERSTPIAFTRGGRLRGTPAPARLPRSAEAMLPLLAAGLNDKTIAHQLRISSATLNRRIAELMKALGTRTRFQMGWRAALEAFPERVPSRRTRGATRGAR